MLRNLKAEMARNDIKAKQLAEFLSVRHATVYDKLNGHYDFSFNEAMKIKRHFFPELDLEYLFDSEEESLVGGDIVDSCASG